jgi:hypothetical protein
VDTLPIIAGLITAVSALLIVFSFVAYRRTGLKRMLSIAGIASLFLIKGILIFLDIADIQKLTYDMWAGIDLIIVVFLALVLFGKE